MKPGNTSEMRKTIMASTDPVAPGTACVDLIFNHKGSQGDGPKPLMERIRSMHGTHIIDYSGKIGPGSTGYELITTDK